MSLAKKKFARVEELETGSGSYGLACIAALREDEEECLRWLESSLKHGKLPPPSHIDEDLDFAKVRDKQWFKEFLAKAFDAEK
ncbi:hypothetical protein ACFL34_05605 [Candidatus Sumerlaeota bacterium]